MKKGQYIRPTSFYRLYLISVCAAAAVWIHLFVQMRRQTKSDVLNDFKDIFITKTNKTKSTLYITTYITSYMIKKTKET